MFVLKFLLIFSLVPFAMMSIIIDLDEEELQQIAAILVENYIETNLVRKQNVHFYKYVKKNSYKCRSIHGNYVFSYRRHHFNENVRAYVGILVNDHYRRGFKYINYRRNRQYL